jgi:hypothetical protein
MDSGTFPTGLLHANRAANRTSYTILPHAIANIAATRTGSTVSCRISTMAATRTGSTGLPHANMAATRTSSTVSCRIPTWPTLEPILLFPTVFQHGRH